MVHLSRIYTRTGDDGGTALGDGTRLPKYHVRIAAYGTIDELSCVLGLALVGGVAAPWDDWLQQIQNDLFDLGSDLCVPGEHGKRIGAVYTKRLEQWIDGINDGLEALNSFILPGGSQASAWLHMGRTVCRRAERLTVELAATKRADSDELEDVNMEVIRYLNRLSDLLFVMARGANDMGKADVLWVPGRAQNEGQE